MSSGELIHQRGAGRWALLSVYMMLVVAIMWHGLANAVGNVTQFKNPQLAVRMDPANSVALAMQADLLLQSRQNSSARGSIKQLALKSVESQAINPAALRLLGFVSALEGHDSKAEELMNMSSRLSRRDLGTRLWLIESAVRKDNVFEALKHYDIALRSNIDSYPILLPTLTGALNDPRVRLGMAQFIKSPPPWMPSFLDTAISASARPQDIATLLIDAGGLPRTAEYEGFSNRLAEQLIAKRQFGAFRDYYLSLKGARVDALATPSLTRSNADPVVSVAGWQLVSGPEVNAAFDVSEYKYNLNISVTPGNRSLVARKLLFLAPGNYNFVASFTGIEEASGAKADWQLQCLHTKIVVPIWTASGDIARGRRSLSQRFKISADCPYQLLEFTVIGARGQNGTDFLVNAMSILKDEPSGKAAD